MKRIVFLTGYPDSGKTTVLLRTVEELKKKGFLIGGMISQEARERGSRVGFRILDLEAKKEGWLAHIRQPSGPTVGRYRVCLVDLESVGAKAILDATRRADIIVIDEVGPMELFSQAFKDAVEEALKSGKAVLGTVHYTARDPLAFTIRDRGDAEIIEVTQNNRDELPQILVREISEILSKNRGKGYSTVPSL